MKFATLTLCFAALTAAAPSTYVFIETNNEIPLHEDTAPSKTPEKVHLNYNDSSVAHYHDKKLLANIRRYFGAFTDPDPEAMRDLQTDDFTISDMRKHYPTFFLCPLEEQTSPLLPARRFIIPVL